MARSGGWISNALKYFSISMRSLILAGGIMIFGSLSQATEIRSLVIPTKKMPETYDPQKIVSINSMIAILQIHRGLMKFTPDLRVELDAASDLQIDDTGLQYTFTLKDRKFSNGTKLTANHVKLTFDRMLSKKIGLAGDFEYIHKVEVLASDKVRFVLKHKSSIFNIHLASAESAILPLKSVDDNIDHKTPGLGPYSISSITDSSLSLDLHDAKNPAFKQSAVSIRFELLDDSSAIERAENGKLDSLDGYSLNKDRVKKFEKSGMGRTVTSVTRQMLLVMNPNTLSIDDRKYIQAKIISSPLSTNLQAIPSLTKANGLIPPGLNGSLANFEGNQKFSVPKKSQTRILRFPLVISDAVSAEIGAWLKSLLSDRYTVEIEPIDIETYIKQIETKKWDIFLRSKFLDYPDGLSVLTYFKSGTKANTFFVESKLIDKMIDDSAAELDRTKRAEIYVKIQKEILDLATVTPILFGTDNQGLWNLKKLHVPSHPLGLQGLPLETVKFK